MTTRITVSCATNLLIVFSALLIACLPICTLGSTTANGQVPAGERLKNLAPEGLEIGGVMHGYDPNMYARDFRDLIRREFSTVTATAYMAYGAYPKATECVRSAGFKRATRWAEKYGKKVHGHTLVYPKANRNLEWWTNIRGQVRATRHLKKFVTRMAQCRKGKIWVWDVVNEVMADYGEPMDENGLNNSYHEYHVVGENYVELAFEWAKQADPDALLILNDFNIAEVNEKSTRVFNYVKLLRERGVPIDGVGFQMHIFAKDFEPDYDSIRENFQRFADEGFKLFITEMDVVATHSDDPSTLPTNAQLLRQKQIYKRITEIAVNQPACKSLLLWDFADDRSWLHPDDKGTYTFPAPFDGGAGDAMLAKPAYYGIQEALAGIEDPEVPEIIDPDSIYEIISQLDPNSGWLTRNGDVIPEVGVRVTNVADDVVPSRSIWSFEPVGPPNVYRIKCAWDGESGYLSRVGLEEDDTFVPGPGVYVEELQKNWSSQLWLVRENSDGGFHLLNGWGSDDGYLTRVIADDLPSQSLSMEAANGSDNQIWLPTQTPELRAVESQ